MGFFRSLFRGSYSHSAQQDDDQQHLGVARTDDERFGTGLWRQHRDRFNRAVDRFYETVVGVHREVPQAAAGFVALTHDLRDLSTSVDKLTATLHREVPVSGMVIPAPVRARVGQAPELFSRAGGKVAEAAQVASMFRASARSALSAGGAKDVEEAGGSAAEKAGRFVADARELLTRIELMDF